MRGLSRTFAKSTLQNTFHLEPTFEGGQIRMWRARRPEGKLVLLQWRAQEACRLLQ